jgi:hypothetical protein
MLVRALKVLRIFQKKENTSHGSSPRQPLISRATKAALMAEQTTIGNGEPWNQAMGRII